MPISSKSTSGPPLHLVCWERLWYGAMSCAHTCTRTHTHTSRSEDSATPGPPLRPLVPGFCPAPQPPRPQGHRPHPPARPRAGRQEELEGQGTELRKPLPAGESTVLHSSTLYSNRVIQLEPTRLQHTITAQCCTQCTCIYS